MCVLMTGKEKAKKLSPSPASKVKEERRKDVKPANSSSTRSAPQEASAEEISEFFGEAKKSSVRQLQVDSEDDSEFEAAKEGRQSDSDDSEDMESMLRDSAKDADFNLEELIQKRLRYIILFFIFKNCNCICDLGLRVARNLAASYSLCLIQRHLKHLPLPLVTIVTARRGRRLTVRRGRRSWKTSLLWKTKA